MTKEFFGKQAFDLVVSVTMLLVLSPLMLVIAMLIQMVMGRPVFFIQERVGYQASGFRFVKFRTMTDTRNSDGTLLEDGRRLTTLGRWLRRFSLDELPQLWNVMRGDMSLVGPRPLFREYLPLYSLEQRRRHEVKPGITGWAQVNGRNAISWEDRFAFDVWYVDHQSFRLDVWILWLTCLRVLGGAGVSQPGRATMEKFTGGPSSTGSQ